MIPSDHVVPPLSDTPSSHHRYRTYPLAGSKKSKERGKSPFMSPDTSQVPVKESTDRKVEQGSLASFIRLRSCRDASIKLRRQEECSHSRASSLPIIPTAESSSSSTTLVIQSPLPISTFGVFPPIPSMHLSASVSERLVGTTPSQQIDLAKRWLKRRLLDQVLQVIEKVLANSSLSDDLRFDALTIRGNIFQKKRQFEFAIRDYREALNICAKDKNKDADTYVLNELTYCYMKQNMYEEAIATADQVLSIDLMNGLAWKYRGLASFYQRNYEQALDCLWKARTYGVADYFVLTTLGEINFTKDKLPQAVSYFEQAYKNYPNLYVLTRLGKFYQLAEDFDQAIEKFSQAINKDRSHLNAYRERGVCYFKRGKKSPVNVEDLSKAIEDFDYYLTKQPRDTEILELRKLASTHKSKVVATK